MRRAVLVLLLLLPCASLVSSAGRAQSATLHVAYGDRVRVVAKSGPLGEFFVVFARPDTLGLRRYRHEGKPYVLPVNSIQDLRVRRFAPVAPLGGMVIGLLAGAKVGADVGRSRGDDPPCDDVFLAVFCTSHTAEEHAEQDASTYGVLGAALGGLVAYATLGHRWQRVDLRQQVGFFRRTDGAIGLTYAYRF